MTLQFEAPGPGTWLLDVVHVERPRTAYYSCVVPPAAMQGSSAGAADYGSPFLVHECKIVHGFPYYRPVRVEEPQLHERERRCIEVFATRAWRDDLARWDQAVKPAFLNELRNLDAVVPSALDTVSFVRHLEAATAAVHASIERHFRWVPCFTLPVGDFIASACEWTHAEPSVVLEMLRGSSPLSTGAEAELIAAHRACEEDEQAMALLSERSGAWRVLAHLQALPGPGAAVTAYVNRIGSHLVTGEDVSDLTTRELPELVLAALRHGPKRAEGSERSDTLVDLERQVARSALPEFNERLRDARNHYRLRDEKGYLNDLHAMGIVRLALLELGRRLADRGALAQPEHALELTPEEGYSLLRGMSGPSATDTAARAAYRVGTPVSVAPELLGEPARPYRSPQGQHPNLVRAARAGGMMRRLMFDGSPRRAEGGSLRGLPASAGTVRGVARVIRRPEDLLRVRAGDVVIATGTTPAYNLILPYVGAFVTERGGSLSHAAIIAREGGVPAVVGCRDAMSIVDGSLIEVDGTTGDVRRLARAE